MSAPGDRGRAVDSDSETRAQPPAVARGSDVRFTPGTLLAGRYRIVAPLGKGGMGEVYRADDIRLGQPVALKFLPAAVAAEPGRLERLVDEVRIGRQVSHPNVCRLYDLAEAEGHHFLVMEYVDGEDLASLLRRIGRLPADKALEIARHLCAGLAAAHDKGVIHRDLKPANVMVDGHGHARIADFGLATLAGRIAAGDVSGTPAYMSPEQLAGGGGSLRSDVFALGLVLYETFTGRRLFEAKTFAELKALHADSKPPSLSSAARDVDPAVERVIQRCLARDPAERPESAGAVLAALPGGDPLQAALLAGETPSPEMVAAAANVGDLRPAVAWSCLLAGLAGLFLVAWLAERRSLARYVPMPKPPEALEARAKDVLARLGYRQPAADAARGFVLDADLLEDIERHDASPARWERLRTLRPGPLRMYYRESPDTLVAESWISLPPWVGLPELGRVFRDEPPTTLPGMTEVVVDTEGRLTTFVAVPPRFDEGTGPWPEVDWSVALTEAGLDPGRLQASAPRWSAPVDSDRKAAWDEVNPRDAETALHVEAAAYHGRLVYFELLATGRRPPPPAQGDPKLLVAAIVFMLALTVALLSAGALLVRRNLRLGRGDRRGALRIATFTSLALVVAQLLRADHSTRVFAEHNLVSLIVAVSCYGGVLLWGFYVALEPVVRRRWPYALVSWSRLLSGRLRDPLVGRDVLVGVLAGLAIVLLGRLGALAPSWFGQAPSAPIVMLSGLNEPRHVAYFVVLSSALALAYSLSALLTFYLFHALVRRVWLAGLLLALEIAFLFVVESGDLVLGALVGAGVGGIFVTVLVRFGLLSMALVWFTFGVLLRTPFTLDWSAWYAGRSLAVLLLFAALLVAAFHTSLGGKPLFGRALLED